MISANIDISLSSSKVFLRLKRFSSILLSILYGHILILTGCCGLSKLNDCCPWKLYEIQVSEDKLKSVMDEVTEKNAKDKDKLKDLVRILESRSNPKIRRHAKGDRYIRYDLERFIKGEWIDGKGWEYLQRLEMDMYASDIDGSDGVVVPKERLPVVDPGVPIVNIGNRHPGVKLSFIHLSDVQLRDERVYMFSEELTRFLDYFSDGFAHDQHLVIYDHSYYLTLTGVMMLLKDRLTPEALKPKFMIHTGDAAHMGVVSEHYEFIYITNNLRIPWYNVLGNHDYTVYGNLSSADVGVIDPNMGFQTLSSRHNFINMHGMGFEIDPMVYFSPENAPHRLDRPKDQENISIYNGFDMEGDESVVQGDKTNPCKMCPGYYFVEAVHPAGGDPGILIVVIDTSVDGFQFSKGSVFVKTDEGGYVDKYKRKQINWLKDVLEKYAKSGNWMVLAFGHHALDSKYFFDRSYKEVMDLFQNPMYNVIAYFCGHTHEHLVKYHRHKNHPEIFGFWEITTDSIMEYPKKGSLVNIVYTEEKSWEITLQSFWPYFLAGPLPDDAPDMLKNAKRCFEASETDDEGRKKKRYDRLDRNHHDARLPFCFPKVN